MSVGNFDRLSYQDCWESWGRNSYPQRVPVISLDKCPVETLGSNIPIGSSIVSFSNFWENWGRNSYRSKLRLSLLTMVCWNGGVEYHRQFDRLAYQRHLNHIISTRSSIFSYQYRHRPLFSPPPTPSHPSQRKQHTQSSLWPLSQNRMYPLSKQGPPYPLPKTQDPIKET